MPCPPSRAEARFFFSSPAAATPCRPPLRSVSNICRPIPGRPGWSRQRCSGTKSRSLSPTSRGSSAARPNISARCRRCSSRSRRCRIRSGCWSSAARSCRPPQQMIQAASVGHAFDARARARARDGRGRSAGGAQGAASGVLARRLVDDACPRAWRCSAAARTGCSTPTAHRSGSTIGAPRMIVLSASSDVVYLAQERRIPTSDARAAARRPCAAIAPKSSRPRRHQRRRVTRRW